MVKRIHKAEKVDEQVSFGADFETDDGARIEEKRD
jgi:hypothetical protein